MLYKEYARTLEADSYTFENIRATGSELLTLFEEATLQLSGNYSFQVEWSPDICLKAFDLAPISQCADTYLDKLVSFFELLSDANSNSLIVLVNAKRYFSTQDLATLYEKVCFLQIPLLLIDSSSEVPTLLNENTYSLDQHFCFE